MNIHESLLDEFKDEQKLKQLDLSQEQLEAWIMVHTCISACVCSTYSGTPLLWTHWGAGEVSCIERCPRFWGK